MTSRPSSLPTRASSAGCSGASWPSSCGASADRAADRGELWAAPQTASTPRSALLILAVAAIAGLSIQRLLGEVRATRDRLSGVLSAATGNAIVATDREGTITVFNPGAERMLGYRAEEVVGSATPALFLDARGARGPRGLARHRADVRAFMAHAAAAGVGDARVDLRAQGRDAAAGVADADGGARRRRARRRLPRRRHRRDGAGARPGGAGRGARLHRDGPRDRREPRRSSPTATRASSASTAPPRRSRASPRPTCSAAR